MGKYDKGREEWKELLDMAHNVIPAGNARGQATDIGLLDLYLRRQQNKATTTLTWVLVIATIVIAVAAVIDVLKT